MSAKASCTRTTRQSHTALRSRAVRVWTEHVAFAFRCLSSQRLKGKTKGQSGILDWPMPQVTHTLEQRRRSPLPVFSFLFRNVFDVVDIGASLRQDVVQVIADADEGETLLEELADTRCPEQEDAENGVVLARVLDQFLRGRAQLGRGIHVRELVLVVEAHRHAKIVLSQEKDVNAGDGRDLGNVFDA